MAVDPNLGDYIPQPANDPSATGGTWQDFIKANRPFLAGMGAQLMVGSPGGVLSNIGAGVAKGNESQNLTEEMNYGRGQEERKFAAGQEEGDKNRASHEKVATISADSRRDVADVKTAGMLERAALIHGPQNNQEMNIYSKARTDYFKKEKDNQIISKKSDATINQEADAWAKEQLRGAREATGLRSQGQPLPSEGANLGGPDSTSGAGKPTTPTTPADKTTTSSQPTWEEYSKQPGVMDALKDPAFKASLLAKRPDFKKYLEPANKGPESFQETPLYKAIQGNKNPNSDYTTPGVVLP